MCEVEERKAFKRKQFNQYNSSRECGRCALISHKSGDIKCPAKGKKCLKCGENDHFVRKCFSKDTKEPLSKKFKREPIRMVQEYDDNMTYFVYQLKKVMTTKFGAKLVTLKLKLKLSWTLAQGKILLTEKVGWT